MKKSRIVLPEDGRYVQPSLFTPTPTYDPYPTTFRTTQELRRILYERDGPIGLDLEYYQNRHGEYLPSIIGIASEDMCGAVPWGEGAFAKEVVDVALRSNRKLVGHAVVGADKPVLDKACNIITPLSLWGDSMLSHYVCNLDLTKSTFKEEDADDSGSLGFMGLWTAASLVVDIPQWKLCRGKGCREVICPTHDVFGYCAIDSWTGLKIYLANHLTLRQFGVDDDVLLENEMLTAQICWEMEEQGIRVDREYVKILAARMKKDKDAIFAHHMEGRHKIFETFNPNAPAQVVEWFSHHNIHLAKSDVKNVVKALEKIAKARSYVGVEELVEDAAEFDEVTKELVKLYKYKLSGKGPEPWFGDKYFRADGLIHPRFITTGSSSTRLASSKPNFQNIGKRGWAEELKRAVIPRHDHLDFVESDSKQLELRACLWLSGLPTELAATMFERLVVEGEGAFDRAAQIQHAKPRFIAKSVVHATDYGEGLVVLKDEDFKRPNIQREIRMGALVVEEGWRYGGGVVCFNGVNLADRLFGSHSDERRAQALELRRHYISKVPELVRWQQRTLRQIEERGYVQLPTGHFVRLYGNARENAKMALAISGQCVGAQYIRGVMRRFKKERNRIPVLNVHDSLVFEVDKGMTNKEAYDFISLMYEEVDTLPGFKAPGDATRGKNYGELEPLVI